MKKLVIKNVCQSVIHFFVNHKKIVILENDGDPPDNLFIISIPEILKYPINMEKKSDRKQYFFTYFSCFNCSTEMDENYVYCLQDESFTIIDIQTQESHVFEPRFNYKSNTNYEQVNCFFLHEDNHNLITLYLKVNRYPWDESEDNIDQENNINHEDDIDQEDDTNQEDDIDQDELENNDVLDGLDDQNEDFDFQNKELSNKPKESIDQTKMNQIESTIEDSSNLSEYDFYEKYKDNKKVIIQTMHYQWSPENKTFTLLKN